MPGTATTLKQQLFAKLSEPTLTEITFNGIPCFVKQWSERERIEWAGYMKAVEVNGQAVDEYLMCRAIVWSLADSSGHLIFTREEAEKVADFSSVEVQRVFNIIIELQTASPVDAKKSLPSSPTSNSISSSPENSATQSATSSTEPLATAS
jgi:hypothetical protein